MQILPYGYSVLIADDKFAKETTPKIMQFYINASASSLCMYIEYSIVI